jgi:hypothetical protein
MTPNPDQASASFRKRMESSFERVLPEATAALASGPITPERYQQAMEEAGRSLLGSLDAAVDELRDALQALVPPHVPNLWAPAVDSLERFIVAAVGFRSVRLPVGRPISRSVLEQLQGRAIVTAWEIATLVRASLPSGAGARWRDPQPGEPQPVRVRLRPDLRRRDPVRRLDVCQPELRRAVLKLERSNQLLPGPQQRVGHVLDRLVLVRHGPQLLLQRERSDLAVQPGQCLLVGLPALIGRLRLPFQVPRRPIRSRIASFRPIATLSTRRRRCLATYQAPEGARSIAPLARGPAKHPKDTGSIWGSIPSIASSTAS